MACCSGKSGARWSNGVAATGSAERLERVVEARADRHHRTPQAVVDHQPSAACTPVEAGCQLPLGGGGAPWSSSTGRTTVRRPGPCARPCCCRAVRDVPDVARNPARSRSRQRDGTVSFRFGVPGARRMRAAAALNDSFVYERRWLTLLVLCISLMVISLDNTILNVAIPTLATPRPSAGWGAGQPAAVDRRLLHARVRRPAAHRRQPRRPLRPEPGPGAGPDDLRRRLRSSTFATFARRC